MVSAQNAAQTGVCQLATKRPTLRRIERRDTVTQRKYRQILATKEAFVVLSVQPVEGKVMFPAHGEIGLHTHAGVPGPEESGRAADILELRGQAFLWGLLETMAVVGTAIVRDEHELFQFVDANEEVELFPRGLAISRPRVGPHQAAGATGHGPAVVAWDEQTVA